MTMETAGVSNTDGSDETSVHVINIIAPKATTIPRFMNDRQNLGERLLILDIRPLSLWVFHIITGKFISNP
jgi:hypothetical protein